MAQLYCFMYVRKQYLHKTFSVAAYLCDGAGPIMESRVTPLDLCLAEVFLSGGLTCCQPQTVPYQYWFSGKQATSASSHEGVLSLGFTSWESEGLVDQHN